MQIQVDMTGQRPALHWTTSSGNTVRVDLINPKWLSGTLTLVASGGDKRVRPITLEKVESKQSGAMSPPRWLEDRIGERPAGTGGGARLLALARRVDLPYAVTWDDSTGEFHRVEGPRGFDSYREAVEASRFLRYTRRKQEASGSPSCHRVRGQEAAFNFWRFHM